MLLTAGSASALTFISPMGEPFHTDGGDKTPETLWFERVDANNDGKITRAEFTADAGRFFRALDVNHDNIIGPEEIDRYEQEIAPEASGFGDMEGRGRMARKRTKTHNPYQTDDAHSPEDDHSPPYDSTRTGASRFGYFDMPEPLVAMDINLDRRVTPKEFVDAAYQRFNLLDTNHDGVLTRDELPHLGGGR
jgi:Ca2+-binding EF-hand superfamily protein